MTIYEIFPGDVRWKVLFCRMPPLLDVVLLMLTVDAKLAQFIESSGLAAGLGRPRHCSGCTLWSLQQDSSLSL